jgi:Fe2+ transport system protein B
MKEILFRSWNAQPVWLQLMIIGALIAHISVLIFVSCIASFFFFLKLLGAT